MTVNGITNVYKIRHGEGYVQLLADNSDDYDVLIMDGKARGRSWKPVRMHRLQTKDHQLRQPSDFPYCPGGALAMNETAKAKIGSHIRRYGEFLPLSCDGGPFWAFQVTHFVDALDENASDVLRSSDEPSVVLMIHKHVFRPERLTPDWMFKLPQSRGRGPIYVTDPFVNLIKASGLTGLEFKRVWPHS